MLSAGIAGTLLFSLGTTFAEPGGIPAVEGEVVRRQKQIFDAEKFLATGKTLVAEGKFKEAIAQFAQAYNGMNPSPIAEEFRNKARQRYAAASVLYALRLIETAEFAEAEEVVDRVLDPTVDPSYQPALRLKQRLQDPEWNNKARTPEHLADVKEVERLLKLGSGSMALGDFDKALDYYASVLRIDRFNRAARRGMESAEKQIVAHHRSSRDHARGKMIREVAAAWETEVEISGIFGLPGGDDSGGNSGEKSVEDKLQSIFIDVINFDDATLEEVIEYLTIKSKQLDESRVGLNFVLQLDPADQLARNANVNLKLRNVPVGEILRHITRDTGTRFYADAFAVRIVSSNAATQKLATKTFRVPPDFLTTAPIAEGAVEDPFAATAQAGNSGLSLKRLGAKEFLMKQGVTFPEGASAIFIPGSSSLVIRNTPSNIELIESFIDSSFNEVPKQVEVHVSMIDISQSELNELGLDWLLGQFNVTGSDRVFAGGGTQGNAATSGSEAQAGAEFPFIPPGANSPLASFPVTSGLRTGKQWNEGDAINNILLSGGDTVFRTSTTLKAPGVFGVGGVLTDPQFQTVLRALSQAKGADLITRPSIVTRSGQRATVDIIREFPYPTEYDPPEIPQNFNGGNNFGGGGGGGQAPASFPVTPAHPTAFEVRNLGTHLEVEPVVGEDNFTVELNLAPEFVQFEGFINYGSPIATSGTDLLGNVESVELTDNRILQPVFKTLRANTSVVVWDDATVVIGGLIEDRTTVVADKVPIFGDTPLLGRFFRSKGVARTLRAVMFFVKVNVIDPSGQRINVRS
ncbi:MAG: Amuc_1098 family type IV pilus outer membrane protein [Verrucomicrobiales bacterium]